MDDLDMLLESTAASKAAPPEISEAPTPSDDLDAFLESIPAASPEDHVDETLPLLPDQAVGDNAAEHAPASPLPGPERDAVAAMETPPLPRQWDNLLGHAPDPAQAAQPSPSAPGAVAVPPEIVERLAHLETHMAELGVAALEARFKVLEDKHTAAEQADAAFAALEKRISALEDTTGNVPATAGEDAMSALNATLEKTAQRVSAVEETLREITAAQPEDSGPDSPDLQGLMTLLQGVEERLGRLETRMDTMESSAGEKLDRAAAAAAARILREELSAILAEEMK
jgi:hypothetical protein